MPVKPLYPRLILFSDPSWCGPCRQQEAIIEAFKKWDTKHLWKFGNTDDCHVQILDDDHPWAEKYEVEKIPCWVRLTADGKYETKTGVLSKEMIAKFQGGG